MLRSSRSSNAKKGSKECSSSSFIGETGKNLVSQLTKESQIRLTRLNLNPKLLSKAASLVSHDTVDFDGDDEVDELPEVDKQQMEQLTTIVDAAYRRVDRNRPSTVHTVVDLPGGSMSELEVSGGGQRGQNMAKGSSRAVAGLASSAPTPTTSYTPLLHSSAISSAESQSTHTSDFHPSSSYEDGEQFLEKVKAMPNTLEKALLINQALQRRLTKNIEQLEETIKQNLRKQLALHDEEDEERLTAEEDRQLRDSDSRYFLRISSFCQPYFKTKIGMPAPKNEDALDKIKNGHLDLYQTKQRPWNKKEMRDLVDAAMSNAREVQLQQLRKKQGDLRRRLNKLDPTDEATSSDLRDQIHRCDRDAAVLQARPLRKVLVPQDIKLDWMKIEAQATNGFRTPDECQHLWETQLSPNISQSDFSAKDDIAIQTAVKSYGKQKPDWAAIATQLSEPRSQYQVFRRYQSFISPALNPVLWSDETKAQLVELVQELRIGDFVPWSQVHQQMPGFNRAQLQKQWQKLNPSRIKGPFTGKEDYTFLKALYRFGLNYSQILKFLPHRNKDQLKDRFKRTIVAGFLTQWTSEMDRELRHLVATNSGDNNRLNTSFWRRLATVDVFAKSGKDAGMLRLRYLILKLWSEVSATDESPPPLFPVSITTTPEEIQELNSHFIHADAIEQRAVVDKVNAGNHIKSALLELSQRRRRLHLEHDHHKNPNVKRELTTVPLRLNHMHLHHLHRQATHSSATGQDGTPIDLRILSHRRATELSWPEQVIMDFFMPSKVRRARAVNLETDLAAIGSIHRLMVGLQVRPLPVKPSEVEVLSRVGIRETEMAIINSMVNRHSCGHKHEYASDAPCLWCSGDAVPECLPLLPPSIATVTALQSLLLHRPSLNDMAQGKFVLHKFTGTDVRQLGDRPRDVRALVDPRKAYEDGDLPRPGMVGKVHITAVMKQHEKSVSVAERLKGHKNRKKLRTSQLNKMQKKKPRWTKRSIVSIYKSFKMGRMPSQYQGAKKMDDEEHVDDPGAAGPSTAAPATGAVKQEAPAPGEEGEVGLPKKKPPKKAGSEKQATPLHEPPGQHGDDDEEDNSPTEISSDEECEDAGLSAEELQARAEGDNLLWHRFLAVFLWPAMMTLVRPSPYQLKHVEEQYNTSEFRGRVRQQQSEEREAPAEPLSDAVQRILKEVKPKERRPLKRPRAEEDGVKKEPSVLIKRGKVVPPPCRASTRQKKLKLEPDAPSSPEASP